MRTLLENAWRRILGYFLVGVLAILPLVVTVAVVIWVVGFMRDFVGPETMVGRALSNVGVNVADADNKVAAYVIGWIVVLLLIFALGVLLQLGAKQFFQRLMDGVLHRIPLVNKIYETTRQFVGLLDKNKGADMQGMTPVFCVFGAEGGTGVLALLVSPKHFRINGQDYNAVIVPTAPVPFGGGLLFVPTKNVQPTDISVDGLMSIYVSMGATTDKYIKE